VCWYVVRSLHSNARKNVGTMSLLGDLGRLLVGRTVDYIPGFSHSGDGPGMANSAAGLEKVCAGYIEKWSCH